MSNKPPTTIYLQWHGDGDPKDPGVIDHSDVTWAPARVFEHDAEYRLVSTTTPSEGVRQVVSHLCLAMGRMHNQWCQCAECEAGHRAWLDRAVPKILKAASQTAQDAVRIQELAWILRQIMSDIPQQRGWLDPEVEARAKTALKETPVE